MEGADARSAVDALLKEYKRLADEKDFAGLANLYSPDAKIYMEGKDEPVMGRQGIMEAAALFEVFGVKDWEMNIEDFIGGADSCTAIGHFIAKNKNGDECFKGKTISVFKKIGNHWFITHDFSNTDKKYDIRAELRERFAKLNQLISAKNFPELVNEMYTDDVRILIPGYPMVKGKADVITLFKEYPMPQILRTDQVMGDIVKISDDVVVDSGGQYTSLDNTGVPVDRGLYTIVWKRVNGKLCIHSDIINPITSNK